MSHTAYDWDAVLLSPRFQAITRRRHTTIAVLGLLAAAYYFAIPAVIAWYPELFKFRLAGGLTLGVVFAVSQYPLGGGLVWVFMRRMSTLDRERDALMNERNSAAAHEEFLNAF